MIPGSRSPGGTRVCVGVLAVMTAITVLGYVVVAFQATMATSSGTANQAEESQQIDLLRRKIAKVKEAIREASPCPSSRTNTQRQEKPADLSWLTPILSKTRREDPPPSTATVAEYTDVCFPSQGKDRFRDPIPWKKGGMGSGWGEIPTGEAFLVIDICKMGHQPKDAALLHAYLQEGGGVTTLLFGNRCITRSPKRKTSFHPVLRQWFEVAVMAAKKPVKTVYIEDHPQGVCVAKAVRRPHKEPFRWFRNSAQAAVFREHFMQKFGVKDVPRTSPRVTILRRGIERHFQEDDAYDVIQRELKSPVEVRYVQFDHDKNPSGTGAVAQRVGNYTQQLQILAETDVLIAAHGAALSSSIALPPGAAVIELFPHNFRYHMYAELAGLLGLIYYPVESPEVWGPTGAYCKGCSAPPVESQIKIPEHLNGVKICKALTCTPPCKKCDIKFVWDDFRRVLFDALQNVRHSAIGSIRRWQGTRYTTEEVDEDDSDESM